jgi:D-3-phosphoglycerate dehydrogenase
MPGRVLGIVGFGRIGSAVARRAHGFGCKILANDPYVDIGALGYPYVQQMDLDPLLAKADIVTLHVPLTIETRGMIDASKLGLMKSTSFLINTSRGPVIDEQALSEALAEKRIASAALDVMVDEPPDPSSPLLELDNVLITPHYGATSAECLVDLDQEAIDSVVAFFNGQWPLNTVNPDVVPRTTLLRQG